MSGTRAIAPVVAVIDWPAAAALKDNIGMLRRAGLPGAGRPRRRAAAREGRALLLRADGSGELHRFTAATVARRLLAGAEKTTTRKAGTERRG